MNEGDARGWIEGRFGGAAVDRIGRFLQLVVAENQRQNLIAPSTIAGIWVRHALDSAQLTLLGKSGLWVDVGTGGGFPGMVVALLRTDPIILVEPRRRRAAFLADSATALALSHVTVSTVVMENLELSADVISARAVAPVEKLLQIGAGCAKKDARWLLPRGRLAATDVLDLQREWRGRFHVEQSITDPDSSVLVIDAVSRR